MGEKTSMFELLKERLTEEEIIKITCDYDLKFCELEEENKQLKSQLQQKENKEREIREYIEKCSILGVNEVDSYCMDYDVRDDLLRILDKENK